MTARGLALLTRPEAESARIAPQLKALGFSVLIEPMLDIHFHAGTVLPLEDVQACLVTSANGARALAASTAPRTLPIWAVGPRTAAVAHDLGFVTVQYADGDAVSLARRVAGALDPADGPLLHASGRDVAGDLAGDLARHGFTIRRAVLYEARAARSFSPALIQALTSGRIEAALFFSPRSGRSFVTLARNAGLAETCRNVDAFAFSPAVAEALNGLDWKSLRHTARPAWDAMLALVGGGASSGKK
ncbi:MAG: uroporphyrinogen-III synthase [Rhodospirillaceae bacterium]|nr:uroporphyrinogen-III synthase [Rhodospirillaceae bacterium]